MKKKNRAVYRLVVIAICIAFLALCSYITIPFAVNFSLQLFAVFLIAGCFPAVISVSATTIYVLIGLVGIPVFSGFNSGLSALLGPSGGFIISFPLIALVISAFKKYYRKNTFLYIPVAAASLILCYVSGGFWYAYVFCFPNPCSVVTALTVTVLPFIIFDIAKLLLVFILLKKLTPFVDKLSV